MFVNKRVYISKNKWCFNVKSSVYCFHMKTKMLANFQICIGIPLKEKDLMPLLWTSTRNRQTYKIHSRNWNLILLAVNTLMLKYLGNWLRLRGNVGQTNNIPGENAWKFRAFLIAFPTMILEWDLWHFSWIRCWYWPCQACHCVKSNHWPKKLIVKLAKIKDASKTETGKKKLKLPTRARRVFHLTPLFLLTTAFALKWFHSN